MPHSGSHRNRFVIKNMCRCSGEMPPRLGALAGPYCQLVRGEEDTYERHCRNGFRPYWPNFWPQVPPTLVTWTAIDKNEKKRRAGKCTWPMAKTQHNHDHIG